MLSDGATFVLDCKVADLTDEQRDKLDKLLAVEPATGVTPLAWLKAVPTAPKADHVRDAIDRLRFVRGIGIDAKASGKAANENCLAGTEIA